MVAGSKGSPRGLQFKRCRLAAFLAAVLAVVGCGLGSNTPPAASPTPRAAVSPSPSPSPEAASFWVLATLGLRLHEAPDPAAPVVTVIRPGAQLDATERRTVNGTVWLHVHAHSSADLDGWVVDDPGLLTSTPMQQHLDVTGGYTLLFPADWTGVQDGPQETTLQSADHTQKILVQFADSLDHLPKAPTAPGRQEREEGPIDVFGMSPLITYYRLDAGGYELALSFLWAPGRAYQFLLLQPAADSGLLKQILSSVIIR